ncbi:Alpha-terpineol synthase, chloroplastic [Quillaja saponaria]|uniref:Alpha-terpineol synthase, chloroplastic n=1 Tax=Quillaja saponaria TaxID=32244 RepID=A0AAD7L2N2_QUISA|nr:Alpha-terpineol synthase, chloroplastic [Quillaja saponaria]
MQKLCFFPLTKMAAHQLPLPPNICILNKSHPVEIRNYSPVKSHRRSCNIHFPVRRQLHCMTATNISDQATVPRSEEKPSNIWMYDYIQSLSSEYQVCGFDILM